MTGRPRLLDLTRVLSRAGLMPTGIDRVELAYLRHILKDSDRTPCFALVRTALGVVLLDARGMAKVLHALETAYWPFPDPLSLLNRRLSSAMRRGQTLARRNRWGRATVRGLDALLARRFPDGFDYFNVGHSNLDGRVLGIIAGIKGARITVMIHDTIPLDYPEWQRSGTVETFAKKFRNAAKHADRIIVTADVTRTNIRRHLPANSAVATIVAPLGVTPVRPDAADLPADLPPDRPYFVTVGTIEPRKNHALLLDLWDAFDADGPILVICGSRGWNNEDVFARLDAFPLNVIERADLSDGAVAALLKGSNGLLFPSHVEGYGLPPLEAAAMGVPVVAADLPIYQEVLGKSGVYLNPDELYPWKKEVERLTQVGQSKKVSTFDAPTWADHFKIVFTER